jgi:hypothetical protein
MGLSTDVILQPIALLLLRAPSKSILLVASSSRQLDNSIAAFGSGGMLTEYEFPSRHSASQTSSSSPNLNRGRIDFRSTWPAFTMIAQAGTSALLVGAGGYDRDD